MDLTVWFDQEEQIVTFQKTEGFEIRTFGSREDKIAFVYDLCESGYRVQ